MTIILGHIGSLNEHVHFHVCVVDGVSEQVSGTADADADHQPSPASEFTGNGRRKPAFARSPQVPVTEALQARAKMGLPPSQFAKLLGVSVRTQQEWEQGRKKPEGAAQTLLHMAVQTPRALPSLALKGVGGVAQHAYEELIATYLVAAPAIFYWAKALNSIQFSQ